MFASAVRCKGRSAWKGKSAPRTLKELSRLTSSRYHRAIFHFVPPVGSSSESWTAAAWNRRNSTYFYNFSSHDSPAEFRRVRTDFMRRSGMRVQERSLTSIPSFIRLRMLVHNGKSYIPVNITPEMVGHKLGEFAPTRKPFSYRCVEWNSSDPSFFNHKYYSDAQLSHTGKPRTSDCFAPSACLFACDTVVVPLALQKKGYYARLQLFLQYRTASTSSDLSALQHSLSTGH